MRPFSIIILMLGGKSRWTGDYSGNSPLDRFLAMPLKSEMHFLTPGEIDVWKANSGG